MTIHTIPLYRHTNSKCHPWDISFHGTFACRWCISITIIISQLWRSIAEVSHDAEDTPFCVVIRPFPLIIPLIRTEYYCLNVIFSRSLTIDGVRTIYKSRSKERRLNDFFRLKRKTRRVRLSWCSETFRFDIEYFPGKIWLCFKNI